MFEVFSFRFDCLDADAVFLFGNSAEAKLFEVLACLASERRLLWMD